MKYLFFVILIIVFLVGGILIYNSRNQTLSSPTIKNIKLPSIERGNPLSISAMRQRSYLGSDIVIEETLQPGSNLGRSSRLL